MYKYILIAALASGLVYLGSFAEKRLAGKKARRVTMVVSYVFAALVFCVVAGLRGSQVGTDVEMYVVPTFDIAREVSFVSFFTEGEFAVWMPISKVLFWVLPNLTHSLFCTLFTIHLVMVVPLLVVLRVVLKDDAWFGVLVFGIAFFPMSLNIMRQFMGMGFIMVAYLYVRKRKPIWFVLFIAVAVLIHDSCLLGLLIYPVWLVSSGQLKKLTVDPAVLGFAFLALVQVFFPVLKTVAPYLGRYGEFINGWIAETQGPGGLAELRYIVFICAVLGLLFLYFTREKKAESNVSGELAGLAAIVFFGVAMFSMCLYSFQMFRLGVFFLYFAVLLIPLAYKAVSARTRKMEFAVVAIALLALFGQSYYGPGSHEVVPYVIDWTNLNVLS